MSTKGTWWLAPAILLNSAIMILFGLLMEFVKLAWWIGLLTFVSGMLAFALLRAYAFRTMPGEHDGD